MFEPAPASIRGYHLTALHNAYGLMAAAAETGKPYACWAHHMSVGGAKVADQLVALGYFARRLDAKPGEIDTYRYRITAAGCERISQPCLLEESQMSETPAPDVEQTSPAEPAPVDLSYPSKHAAPNLKIVEDAQEDPERIRIRAADALMALTPGETQLLASIHADGGQTKVPYSLDRVSLTKKGLIVLLHRKGLDANPMVQLTPLGEAAAALNAEMRVPEDDEEADDSYDASFDEIVGYDETDPEYRAPVEAANEDVDPTPEEIEAMLTLEVIDETRETKEIPAVELGDVEQPDEVAELRADRDAMIEQQLDMERQIKALRDELAAVKSALADEDGAIPDDPAATIAALKLHAADQQATIDTQHAVILNMRAQLEVAAQETDVMKRDITGLKLQIAAIADGEMGLQHDWTHKTTPADITARTLAGWTPWHKELTPEGLFVVWERKPNQKPFRRERNTTAVPHAASYSTPAQRPAPVSGGVLQPTAVIDPADLEPAPLTPMSAVMGSFTRNLHAQFDANPLPIRSDRPTR